MNEINKLAIGLDPSCTHIKKQTYEDVSVFKERLSMSFEYSGQLNEEHLKSLMEKAITRRRGELMKLIQSGGTLPNHIDSKVWERLLKLQRSKQWEEKSQQGKYANACRKTINYTGKRGVNGVRESLRELLGRSPDPEEVYAEARQHKGYDMVTVKKEKGKSKCEDSAGQESSEEDGQFQSADNS